MIARKRRRETARTGFDGAGSDASELIGVLRVLLLLQGAVALLNTLEAMFWEAAAPTGALIPTILLSGAVSVTLLALAAGVGRPWRRARRLILIVESFVLLFALLDLGLALAIAHAPLGLVAILTRLVLPIAVIKILRRDPVRAYFSASGKRKPARRRRAAPRKRKLTPAGAPS